MHVLEGNAGLVWSVAWGSLDGAPVLASGGHDGTVRVWNPGDGTQLRVLEGHRGAARAVAWGSLDGAPVLASAGDDGTVRVWNPGDGTQLRLLEGHSGGVWALAWGTLDGDPVLVSGGADGTVRLWGRSRVAVINFGDGVLTVSLGPGGWLGVAGWEVMAVLVIGAEVFANPQTARRRALTEVRSQQGSATGRAASER
jgi:WD40 repeat protein